MTDTQEVKVGDIWYRTYGHQNIQISRITVTKVTKIHITFDNGITILRRTYRPANAGRWDSVYYYPGTPENTEKYESQIKQQKLINRISNLLTKISDDFNKQIIPEECHESVLEMLSQIYNTYKKENDK